VYVGLAIGGPSGYPYAIASNGNFYGWPGLPVSGAFGSSAWFATASSGLLYTLQPALSGVGTYNFIGAVSGLIAFPGAITNPTALLYSGGLLALGGWQNAPALSGAAAAALCPITPTLMLGAGSGVLTVWTSPGQFSDAWAQTQRLTASVNNLTTISWRPDGVQALAAAPSAGNVQVFGNASNVMSLAQTLAVPSVSDVTVAGTSINAIACQSGLTHVTPLLYNLTSWVTGAVVSGLAGNFAAVPVGTSGMAVAHASGVAFLTVSGGAWTIISNLNPGFVPTAIAADSLGFIYAGGVGSIAQISSAGSLLASGSWTGAAPTALAIQQGRIIAAIPGDGLLRVFGLTSPGILSQQSTAGLSLGSQVGLGLSYTTLFALGSGATLTYGFSGTSFSSGTPYVLSPVLSGAVATYSGSTWTTTPLGIGNIPSAMTFDASGSLQVATAQNTWWTIASGAVQASGIVPQYPGQLQNVPLGAAALLASGGHLYAATSLAGVLIELE